MTSSHGQTSALVEVVRDNFENAYLRLAALEETFTEAGIWDALRAVDDAVETVVNAAVAAFQSSTAQTAMDALVALANQIRESAEHTRNQYNVAMADIQNAKNAAIAGSRQAEEYATHLASLGQ